MSFATHMVDDNRAQLALQRDLSRATEQPDRGELSLHYQPKVDARDGRISGVEALAGPVIAPVPASAPTTGPAPTPAATVARGAFTMAA